MMKQLVPITKILLTGGTAVWALVLHRPLSLVILMAAELLILLVSGQLLKNIKAVLMLGIFAFFWGLLNISAAVRKKNVSRQPCA